ncbi:MAG: 50S ribosomal protein L32 [Phycisphaerae bacterium]
MRASRRSVGPMRRVSTASRGFAVVRPVVPKRGEHAARRGTAHERGADRWFDAPRRPSAVPIGGFVMVPTKKTSKSRTRTRRAHHALRPVTLSPCPQCGKPKLPHCACRVCGYASAKVALPFAEKET